MSRFRLEALHKCKGQVTLKVDFRRYIEPRDAVKGWI